MNASAFMLHAKITPRLCCEAGVLQGQQHAQGNDPVHGRLHSASSHARPDIPVPRLDLLLVLVLAAACGAITAAATGHFEPLPLFAGVIVAGVVRSLRTARQRG
jgi:hypothetical protein